MIINFCLADGNGFVIEQLLRRIKQDHEAHVLSPQSSTLDVARSDALPRSALLRGEMPKDITVSPNVSVDHKVRIITRRSRPPTCDAASQSVCKVPETAPSVQEGSFGERSSRPKKLSDVVLDALSAHTIVPQETEERVMQDRERATFDRTCWTQQCSEATSWIHERKLHQGDDQALGGLRRVTKVVQIISSHAWPATSRFC